MSDGIVVIEGQDAAGRNRTDVARLIVLKHALRLEARGLRRSRGSSAFSVVKKEFKLKGSKQEVLRKFEEIVARIIEEGKTHVQ